MYDIKLNELIEKGFLLVVCLEVGFWLKLVVNKKVNFCRLVVGDMGRVEIIV